MISVVDGCAVEIRRRAWPHERRSALRSERGSHAVRNPSHPGGEDWVDRGWWHRWNRSKRHISMRAGGEGEGERGCSCGDPEFFAG